MRMPTTPRAKLAEPCARLALSLLLVAVPACGGSGDGSEQAAGAGGSGGGSGAYATGSGTGGSCADGALGCPCAALDECAIGLVCSGGACAAPQRAVAIAVGRQH